MEGQTSSINSGTPFKMTHKFLLQLKEQKTAYLQNIYIQHCILCLKFDATEGHLMSQMHFASTLELQSRQKQDQFCVPAWPDK